MAWQLRKAIKKSTPFGSFSWTVCVPCPPLGRCLVKKRVVFFAVAGAMPLVVAADWCCYFVVVGRSPWWNGIPLLWTASSSCKQKFTHMDTNWQSLHVSDPGFAWSHTWLLCYLILHLWKATSKHPWDRISYQFWKTHHDRTKIATLKLPSV